MTFTEDLEKVASRLTPSEVPTGHDLASTVGALVKVLEHAGAEVDAELLTDPEPVAGQPAPDPSVDELKQLLARATAALEQHQAPEPAAAPEPSEQDEPNDPDRNFGLREPKAVAPPEPPIEGAE